MTRSSTQKPPPEELPYFIELWHEADTHRVERVLARATSSRLAREILKAAMGEYPGRRVTLRKGAKIVGESDGT